MITTINLSISIQLSPLWLCMKILSFESIFQCLMYCRNTYDLYIVRKCPSADICFRSITRLNPSLAASERVVQYVTHV